jgi:hypothetical protein
MWWKRFNSQITHTYRNRWGIAVTQCYYAGHQEWFLDSLVAEGFCTSLALPTDVFGYIANEDMHITDWLRMHEVDLNKVVVFFDILYLQDDMLHAILKLKLDTR